jgi:hypothetical protein
MKIGPLKNLQKGCEQWGGLIFEFFYIFNKRTSLVCCIPFKSKENEKKFVLTQ